MKKVLFALIALFSVVFLNAQNPSTNRLGAIRVENGIIYFPEGDVFFNEAQKMANMTDAEMKAFESRTGFRSLRSKINSALEELEKDETGKNRATLKTRHASVIKFTATGYEPIVESPLYTSIANENGLYYAGKELFKILDDDRVIQIKDGSLAKLKMAESNMQDKPAEGIFIKNRKNGAMRTANCDNQTSQTSVDGKRRATIKTGVVPCYGCCGGVRYAVYVKVWGEIKRMIINVWDPYKTELAFSQVGFEIVNSFGNTVNMNNLSAASNGDVRVLERTYYIDPNMNYNLTNTPSDCSFIKVKGKGHSRGLGSTRFAILCTGYLTPDCP
jgi:hypothetical protein